MNQPLEECVIYQEQNLFVNAFPVMEEIRRQGKLCDVTLKVNVKENFEFLNV